MTRINCVPPSELSREHLIAEYRELPRVFKLAESAAKRGNFKPMSEYVLGSGHVKFFYTRLGYCVQRFRLLVGEMLIRGYNPNHLDVPKFEVPESWMGQWQPSENALKINRQRIFERSNHA